MLVLLQVIIPIGQAEPALREIKRVDIAVLEVGVDVRGDRAGVAGLAEQAHQLERGIGRLDPREIGLQRRHALGVDRIGVEERLVGIGDARLVAAGPGLGGHESVEDRVDAVGREVVEHDERAPARLVRRDLRLFQPLAVDVEVEVVTRLHRAIEVLGLDAEGAPITLARQVHRGCHAGSGALGGCGSGCVGEKRRWRCQRQRRKRRGRQHGLHADGQVRISSIGGKVRHQAAHVDRHARTLSRAIVSFQSLTCATWHRRDNDHEGVRRQTDRKAARDRPCSPRWCRRRAARLPHGQ